MRIVLPVVLGFVASGCLSSSVSALDEQRRAAMFQIRDLFSSKVVRPSCGDDPKAPPAPPSVRAVEGLPQVRQPCGLVTVELEEPAAIAKFTLEICAGIRDSACESRYRDTFMARLEDRYAFADWNVVANKCRAYPVDCKDWFLVELWVLKSHNDGVSAWGRQQMEQANASYMAAYEQAYAEDAERRSRWAGALRAIGSGISGGLAPTQSPTVHCVSNTYGTTSNTTCN
jgi:hypothetical protein